MTCALVTLLAPSVKATAPAALSRPISVISLPSNPLVIAAIGCTCTIALSRARRSTKSTVAGLSIGGDVSGWQITVVTPPAAAAWLAEASVSRLASPGSPMKARISIRPGAISLPRQSITSVPSGTPAAPMPFFASRMRPSAMNKSPTMSRLRVGSTIRALASRIGRRSDNITSLPFYFERLCIGQVPRQSFEHGHAYSHAHLDLLTDQGLRAVGDKRVNLDAAVHRSRVHNKGARLGVCEFPLIEAIVVEVFRHRWHIRTVHAFALQSQHHDNVGVGEAFPHVARDLDAEALDAGRQERGRRNDPDPRAHCI